MSDNKKNKKIEELETGNAEGEMEVMGSQEVMKMLSQMQAEYDKLAMHMTKRELLTAVITAGFLGRPSGSRDGNEVIEFAENMADEIIRRNK